jgi:mannitol 2-dehydrogenase
VLCEDYAQWVLEDEFPLGRPQFEEVGVQPVEDVRPYELMKLRLLNASHQALAYSGILSGHVYAHDGASDPVIEGFLRAYMDQEAVPTLDPVPGVDLGEYRERLIARFANSYVGDTLTRLAADASDRIPKFLVPVVRERRAVGASAPLCAAVMAGWACYAERAIARDGALPDRQQAAVRTAVAHLDDEPVSFLRNREWFGDLADDGQFATDFVTSLTAFRGSTDPRTELARLTR